jgi:hypothetical protein
MKWSRGLVLLGAFAVLIGISGCAAVPSIGVADQRRPGVPEGVDIVPFMEGPAVVAYDDGSIDVVTWGSGSCPAEAASAEKDGVEFVVVFTTNSEGVCTADMAPTTHTFSAESVGSRVPETATVRFQEYDDEIVVDVIRAEERGGISP